MGYSNFRNSPPRNHCTSGLHYLGSDAIQLRAGNTLPLRMLECRPHTCPIKWPTPDEKPASNAAPGGTPASGWQSAKSARKSPMKSVSGQAAVADSPPPSPWSIAKVQINLHPKINSRNLQFISPKSGQLNHDRQNPSLQS